jgi:serine/threonine protein kinase
MFSFGEVWKGTWAAQVCVIKKLKDSSEDARAELIREATQLAQLPAAPSICTFYGVSLDGPTPCVALEFIQGGELKALLYDLNEKLASYDIVHMALNLAAGMEVLHEQNVLHLDLAARNLLVTVRDPLTVRITEYVASQ